MWRKVIIVRFNEILSVNYISCKTRDDGHFDNVSKIRKNAAD